MNTIKAILLLLTIIAVPMTFQDASAAERIPSFMKQNIIWFGQGQISEDEFINALTFLMNQDIIVLDQARADIIKELRDENKRLRQQTNIESIPAEPLEPAPKALPELPGFCPEIYDPVCGRDGMTYENECRAEQEGVGVSHKGECKRPDVSCPSGHIWIDCARVCVPARDSVCPTGMSMNPNTGRCMPHDDTQPCVCPKLYSPICGADGNTYGNSCKANCAGVDISHEGECEVVCPQVYDPVCGIDDKTYGNACEAKKADVAVSYEGECIVCPKIYDPVCGTDGNTYGNACEADKAGTKIAHEGECRVRATGDQ